LIVAKPVWTVRGGSAFVVLLSSLAEPIGAAPMVHLDLGSGGEQVVVRAGTTFTVRVLASAIPEGSDGLGLFGFGFGLTFDSAGLSAGAPAAGPLWDGTGFLQLRNQSGDIGLLANRFFEAAGPFGDDILLGSFEVTALEEGLFVLDVGYFSGAGDNVLFDGTVLDGDPQSFFRDGSVRVLSAVPGLDLLPRIVLAVLLVLLAFPMVRGGDRRGRGWST
jgi:hypothetical protein